VKQVIHHCADSHMNSFIRSKLALTEKIHTRRPYNEDVWVNLAIFRNKKWVRLLKSLTKDQLELDFVHPAHGLKFNIAENIGNSAWHCNHHLAHISNVINSRGKYK
jgi:hypothetical protein